MNKVPVNHEILKWARETLNLSVEQVAKKMQKSVDDIISWENGTKEPTYVQLEKLAYEIYQRPIAIFFFPEPPQDINLKVSFRTLPEFEYEKLSSTTIKLFRRAQSMQLKLHELCGGVNPSKRRILKNIRTTEEDDIRELTRIVRSYFGVNLDEQKKWKSTKVAFDNWRSIFEDSGIFVFKQAFRDDQLSGFCLYDDIFPVIFVNNSMPKTRQIFTLFHELAHLIHKTGGIDKTRDDYVDFLSGENRKVEVFCNSFAGEFLVPTDEFAINVSGAKIDEQLIDDMAQTYSVSKEVILRKLLQLGLVNRQYYDEKAIKWTRDAKQQRKTGSGGNYYYTKATYLGKRYLELVFSEYYQERISLYQVADYLNVKLQHIPRFETMIYR